MLASTVASLPPPLRGFPRGACRSAAHGGAGASNPLRPAPRRRALVCRADLQQDAPFAAAIGACVLASLALPPRRPRRDAGDEDEEEGVFSSTDTRMGVMGIISFLPYFNWLSWIFAWLDSGKWRYLVYAAVYLAPYLRSNLSLSPEESWLPIASIFICILHIQLEAAVRNGDIESFKLVERAWNLFFPSATKEKDPPPEPRSPRIARAGVRLAADTLPQTPHSAGALALGTATKEKDAYHGNKRDSIEKGNRPNKRIPSAHESRERLRNSDIFKRRIDEPIDEKRKKSDWD